MDRPARLSGPDLDEDAAILDHIEARGLHVLVDDRSFYLDCGIEVSLVRATRTGETADGAYRWRCTLRIVDPMPGLATIEAYADEGPVPNRVGQIFHRTIIGRQQR
jgi:hypothetical protein